MGVHQCESTEDFKKQLKDSGSKLVVVDFYADWCGPCKMIAPHVEKLSNELGDVVFLKVDVDAQEEIAQEYKISAMPTFIFIKNGKNLDDNLLGANFEKLKELVQKHKD